MTTEKPQPATLGDDTSQLSQLGSKSTDYAFTGPSVDILETFPNQHQERPYTVKLSTDEFTSLCPKTSQPDYGSITITYVPDKLCVETKSLKLYFFAFRNVGSFMETIVNTMLRDLVTRVQPREMTVNGKFASRGSVVVDVTAIYVKD